MFLTSKLFNLQKEKVMKKKAHLKNGLATFTSAIVFSLSGNVYAESFSEAFSQAAADGKAYINMRLRSESVEQNNAALDADAITLRTKLGYKTGVFNGFSAVLEVEDSRVFAGKDDYFSKVGAANGYSVIADPEVTEVDQAFLQYSNDNATLKLGSQVIVFDGQRFVGHVGWRQDRQTFDAAKVTFKPAANIEVTAAHIYKRNRIFAEAGDQKSSDNLFNVSYKAKPLSLTAYAYLLEDEFGSQANNDTYGVSLKGSEKLGGAKLVYAAEFASQSYENQAGADFDADYMAFELGLQSIAALKGVSAKVGYEVLGSDEGSYGFSTPLATLHKFNGWADTFLGTPAQGLVDAYVGIGAKVGPGKLSVVYHDFSADEASASVDDLGSELDIAYGMKFGKHYNAGIKYADYQAADGGKVDIEKLWIWVGLSI